jgi:hypothetical protein
MSYAVLVPQLIRLGNKVRLQIRRATMFAMVGGLAVMMLATAGRGQESRENSRSKPKVNTVPPSRLLAAQAQVQSSSLTPHKAVQASAPQVSYDGKQLTIIANNSTLSEILEAVHTGTGAEMDVPTSASSERLAEVRLGPGPPREVLASLLDWTSFGYIIQAPDANPLGIRSVLLVERSKNDAVVAAGGPAASASQSRLGATRRVVEPDPIPVPIPVETPAPENPAPPQPGTPPGLTPPELQPARPTPEITPPTPQPFRTPDQMIQELQNLYQQRQQLQRIQNGSAGISPQK